jgi:hypothetical protein
MHGRHSNVVPETSATADSRGVALLPVWKRLSGIVLYGFDETNASKRNEAQDLVTSAIESGLNFAVGRRQIAFEATNVGGQAAGD